MNIQQFGMPHNMKKNIHVVPHNGKWGIKVEGNKRVTITADTQKEAIDKAREIARAQEAELLIHRPNGQIRERDSYGNDPYPPEG